MENKYKIYMLTFPNGKKYCGYTSQSLNKRWNNGNGYKKCPLVWRAIQKYGWENITKELIFSSNDSDECLKKEKEIISQNNLTNPDYGYNLHEGGMPTGSANFLTDEGRLKISQSSKRNWQDPDYIEKMKNRKYAPHIFTDEDRQKAANYHKGRTPLNAKPVVQIDLQTDAVIQEFISASHAAIALMGDRTGCSNILNVCKGKRKSAYGYRWRFKDYE